MKSLAESKNQNVPEFHGIVKNVQILGYEGNFRWHTDGEGLHVVTDGMEADFPVVLKVEVE